MKPAFVIFITAFCGSAFAQGTFQNLDFEQANPVFVNPVLYPSIVTTSSALPNWLALAGGAQLTQISEDNPSTGAPWVMLIGPGSHFGYSPIDGNYSVLLQGSSSAASINQNGIIPVGTQSLLFEAQPGAGALDFNVGSQTVPITELGTGANYTLYGVNISAWAGDSEQLTFEALANQSGPLNNWVLDNISFSTQAVPEPSPLALTGVGGLMFALCRRFAPALKR